MFKDVTLNQAMSFLCFGSGSFTPCMVTQPGSWVGLRRVFADEVSFSARFVAELLLRSGVILVAALVHPQSCLCRTVSLIDIKV